MVTCFSDIFNALNLLNLGLQRRDNNILQVEDKIETMLKKLSYTMRVFEIIW